MKAKARSIEQIIEEQVGRWQLKQTEEKKKTITSLSSPSQEKPEVVGIYWPKDFPNTSSSTCFIKR